MSFTSILVSLHPVIACWPRGSSQGPQGAGRRGPPSRQERACPCGRVASQAQGKGRNRADVASGRAGRLGPASPSQPAPGRPQPDGRCGLHTHAVGCPAPHPVKHTPRGPILLPRPRPAHRGMSRLRSRHAPRPPAVTASPRLGPRADPAALPPRGFGRSWPWLSLRLRVSNLHRPGRPLLGTPTAGTRGFPGGWRWPSGAAATTARPPRHSLHLAFARCPILSAFFLRVRTAPPAEPRGKGAGRGFTSSPAWSRRVAPSSARFLQFLLLNSSFYIVCILH